MSSRHQKKSKRKKNKKDYDEQSVKRHKEKQNYTTPSRHVSYSHAPSVITGPGVSQSLA
jgi:hypothetical protein